MIQGVIAEAGRLDRALAEACAAQPGGSPLSRERIKALISEGLVTIDGRAVGQASQKVAAGARFAITLPATTALDAVAQDIPLTIAYEDEHLIVVDKPAGLVVHPAAGNLDGTLVNALLHHCAQNGGGRLSGIGGVARPGIVHRIDKDTSGLLVVAKSDIAHEGLARQFADHSIERAYFAITNGVPIPQSGTLRGVIARSPVDRKKMAIQSEDHFRNGTRRPEEGGRGKHAVTHYRLIEALGEAKREAALVECRLETGRTHQVRGHMASIGHPLLGDPVYGRSQKSLKPILRCMLRYWVLLILFPARLFGLPVKYPQTCGTFLPSWAAAMRTSRGFPCYEVPTGPRARGRHRKMPLKGLSMAR